MILKFALILVVVLPFVLRWVWRFKMSLWNDRRDPRLDGEAKELRLNELAQFVGSYPHLKFVGMIRKLGELLIPLGLMVLIFGVLSATIPPLFAVGLAAVTVNAVIFLNWWASAQELALLKSKPNLSKHSPLFCTAAYQIAKDAYPRALWLLKGKR